MRWEADPAAGLLRGGGQALRCRFGRGGTVPAAEKREGDGATPEGEWPLLAALLRPGRVVPPGARPSLPWRWLRPDDGWSDDPRDPAYNRPVRLPHPFSAERLWRGDALYDALVVLGHNHRSPEPGRGSAIFLHAWRDDGAATEGCVAVARDDLLALLSALRPGDTLRVG